MPAGALLWAWEENAEFGEKAGEQWLILLPDKWNRQVHYGWRFDPAQLRQDKEREAGASGRAQGVRGRRRGCRAAAEDSAMTDAEES